MNNRKNDEFLCGMLVLLVPLVINEIMENENISETEAAEDFYMSELYAALEDESTKLWHLSPKALYFLYRQEKENGYIIYPEEA